MRYILLSLVIFMSSCNEEKAQTATELKQSYYFAGEGESSHQRRTRSLYQKKQIVLTYDDHAGPSTVKLLDVLKKEKVKATFFYNTKTVNPKSLVIKRLIKEGHILASHQHTHIAAREYRNKSHFESDLINSVKIIEQAYEQANVDNEGVYFRYPYGAIAKSFSSYDSLIRVGRHLYSENCINYVFWDIDTIDWALKDANRIFENVKNHLEGGRIYVWENSKVTAKSKSKGYGGGIVLMHDKGRSYAVEATKKIIRWGKSQGYEFISLNRVDGYRFDDRFCRYRF